MSNAVGARQTQVKTITALARGLTVIDYLEESDSSSLMALHRATGMPKASLLRVLKTLETEGWAGRRIADGAYFARQASRRKNESALQRVRVIAAAGPVLRRLAVQSPSPSDIAVRDGLSMLVLDSNRNLYREAGDRSSLARPSPGYRPNFLWSAMGRAYLAFCSVSERESLLHTIAISPCAAGHAPNDHRWIDALVNDTRARGYSIRDQRQIGPDANGSDRYSAIAVPVISNDRVIACVSSVWLIDAIDERTFLSKALRPLNHAARAIATAFEAA